MARLFCPKCGKSVDRIYGGLCENCFLDSFKLYKRLPEKLHITLCKECGKFYREKNSFISMENAIEDFFKNLKFKEIKSVSYRIFSGNVLTELHLEINGLRKIEETKIRIVQSQIICKFCSMKLGGYYTAILQIRGKFNINVILNDVENLLEKLKTRDSLAFISKIVENKNGIDLYLGSKGSGDRIIKLLKDKYKVKVKISRKLYGERQGKRVYRNTILVIFGGENGKIR